MSLIIRKKKKKINKTPALKNCPQKKGLCLHVHTITPKKPNSAKRKVARVKISRIKYVIFAYVPGQNHTLTENSKILMCGGKVQDVPFVKYQLIRGKYDFLAVKNRQTSRSKYGAKKQKRTL